MFANLIVKLAFVAGYGVKVMHLQRCVVSLSLLCMFRRHMEANVRKIPTLWTSSAKVDTTKAPRLRAAHLASQIVRVLLHFTVNQRLADLQGVSCNGKCIQLGQIVKATTGSIVIHFMDIDAFIPVFGVVECCAVLRSRLIGL